MPRLTDQEIADIKRIVESITTQTRLCSCERAAILRALAELQEARKDSERLEWYFAFQPAKSQEFVLAYLRGMYEHWTLEKWRAAIDQAREHAKE